MVFFTKVQKSSSRFFLKYDTGSILTLTVGDQIKTMFLLWNKHEWMWQLFEYFTIHFIWFSWKWKKLIKNDIENETFLIGLKNIFLKFKKWHNFKFRNSNEFNSKTRMKSFKIIELIVMSEWLKCETRGDMKSTKNRFFHIFKWIQFKNRFVHIFQ